MPQQTKIFRVFVSSTFADMQEERLLLQNEVFPKLEKLCLERNARFQAVDLRWGVTEASQLNQKTLAICLNEVARCQCISPKPNFLILLANRYGWQPIPEVIPENEWNEWIRHVDAEDVKLMREWYKKDENAVPAVYLLQPRLGEYADDEKWWAVDERIKSILRHAVEKSSLSDQQNIKYFTSATHQEIMSGALNPPVELENPGKHVFAFERKADIDTLATSAGKFIDMTNGQVDKDTLAKLDTMKGELKDLLQDNYIRYDAAWDDDRTRIADPVQYTDMVFQKLKSIIEEQLETVIEKEEFAAPLQDTKTLPLPLLPPEEAEIILAGWLDSINRKLTPDQYNHIISLFRKTALPIYLKIAFEMASHWTSYQSDISLNDSVEGIITEFFDRLEPEFPDRFVEHAVCYMLSGRYQGLAENEILDVLVFDEEHWELFLSQSHQDHREELREAGRIPIAVWSRLYFELEPFLTERDADGVPIITFFHRQFVEVLMKKYGLS